MKGYYERFPFGNENYKNGAIIAFFKELNEDDFLETLEDMSNDVSVSLQAYGYFFASSQDEEDLDADDYFEEGVMFHGPNDDDPDDCMIVDYQMFYDCVKIACDIYLERHPDSGEKIEECLSKIRNRYHVK